MNYITEMPDSEYFAMDALSASRLKAFAKAPALVNIEIEETEEMKIGTCTHGLALEDKKMWFEQPATFENSKGKTVKLTRQSAEGKELIDKLLSEALAAEKKLLKPSSMEHLRRMAAALKKHPDAKSICGNPQFAERVLIAVCPRTGLLLKAKADFLDFAEKAIKDLKTTNDAEHRTFERKIILDYWVQACHYLYVASLIEELEGFDRFIFYAVERSEFAGISVHEVSISQNRWAQYFKLLDEYAAEKALGDFSAGYPTERNHIAI